MLSTTTVDAMFPVAQTVVYLYLVPGRFAPTLSKTAFGGGKPL